MNRFLYFVLTCRCIYGVQWTLIRGPTALLFHINDESHWRLGLNTILYEAQIKLLRIKIGILHPYDLQLFNPHFT